MNITVNDKKMTKEEFLQWLKNGNAISMPKVQVKIEGVVKNPEIKKVE